MAGEREFKIKKSIASSIAEIAQILGPEIVEKDIIPVFDSLYQNEGINSCYTIR